MDEPVYIDIDLRQNIDTESKKGESALNALAEKSLITRDAVSASLARQAEVVRIAAQNVKEVEKALSQAADKGAQKQLAKELELVKNELAIESEELKKLTKESERLEQSNSALMRRLNGVRSEMRELYVAGKQHTDRYRELRLELKQLSEAHRMVQVEQAKLGRGRSMDGLVQGVQGLTAAFTSAYGAVALVSGSSAEYEKIQAKLQGTMALVIGLQQMQATLASTSAFRIQTVSKVTQVWTTINTRLTAALWGSTVAAKGLMIALTGGLSVAIGFAISALDKFISKRKEARELEGAVSKSVASSVGEQMAAYQRLRGEWEQVKNGQKSVNEFIRGGKESFDTMGVAVTNASEAERLMSAQTPAVEEALMRRAKAAAMMEVASELYKKGMDKIIQADDNAKNISGWDKTVAYFTLRDPRKVSEDRAERERRKGREDIAKAEQFIRDSLSETSAAEKQFENLGIKLGGKAIQGTTKGVKKYAGELEKLSADLERAINASIIAVMEEGAAKEMAELDARHEERKAKIKEQYAQIAQVEKEFGVNGNKQRGELKKLEEAQEREHDKAVATLRKSSAKAISDVLADLNASSLSEAQRRTAALEAEYDKAIKTIERHALTAAEKSSALAAIEVERMMARARLKKELELEHLEFEEQVAIRRAELHADSGIFTFDGDREEHVLRVQAEHVAKRIAKLQELAIAGVDVAKALEDARVEQERLNYAIDQLPLKKAQEWGNAVKSILGSLAKLGGEVGEVFSELDSNIDKMLSTLDKKASTPQKIAGVVSSMGQLVGMALKQAKDNAEVEAKLIEQLESAYHRAALARIQALEYKPDNIFGVEDPYKKIIAGAKQYKEVMTELGATISKLSGGQVQTGTKEVISGKNIISGTAAGATAGATIGSFIPIVGNILGGVIGGVLGGIFGAARKKVVPVFKTLATEFGGVLKKGTQAFELNPKILENYDRLDDKTKKLVDNWEEIRKNAIAAEKQMEESFKALAGDLGQMLSKSLADGFKSGDIDGALKDFDSKVNETIMGLMEQQLFATYFKEHFDRLQEDMKASFKPGGDGEIIDDIKRFKLEYRRHLDEYKKARAAAQAELQAEGFANDQEDSRKAVARRGLAQASQDSIDELMGIETNSLMQLRILVDLRKEERAGNNTRMVLLQSIARNVEVIAENSAFLRKLEDIAKDIAKLNREGVTLKK